MLQTLVGALLLMPTPAPAQSRGDEAFAASLGRIQGALVPAARRLQEQELERPAPDAQARSPLPAAPDELWQKIVTAVRTRGEYEAQDGRTPATFALEAVTGDPKADHVRDEVSFAGTLDGDGLFVARLVAVVHSEVKRDAATGAVATDTWRYVTDVHGQVLRVLHFVTVEVDGGSEESPEDLEPADPRIKARFDAMLKLWSERSAK